MRFLQLIVLGIAALAFANCKRDPVADDVSFARNTFESLARGDSSVAHNIDWETLRSLDSNVGATYTALQTDQERQEYVRSYVTQFASSFRENGGSISNITNWRVDFHDDHRTDVLADAPGGTLKITVTTRDGVERVSSLKLVPLVLPPTPAVQ